MAKYKVIDADNNRLLETFQESEKDQILEKYENDGRWEDVAFDCDGDLILWEEL